MSSDFGGNARRRPRRPPMVWVVFLITFGLMTAIVAAVAVQFRQDRIAQAKAWTLAGEACPSLSREVFAAQRLSARRITEYDGMMFGRMAGHVKCTEIGKQGGKTFGVVVTCQFTGPGALTVKTSKGEWYFNPGIGQSVAVTMQDGAPHCLKVARVKIDRG